MKTNIFRSAYTQHENKLTYCFLSLLEHLEVGMTAQLLAESGLPAEPYDRLQVELLYGGAEANPDGSLVLGRGQKHLTIFFENKTWRRQLDIEQIRRHIRVHLNDSPDRRLLVITTDSDQAREIAAIQDSRIHFMTWHQVAESAEVLSHVAAESKDRLLLSEFCQYLETSGEAWRAKMPDSKLIEAHAQYLKIATDEGRFLNECQRLMEALREVADKFTNEITDVSTEGLKYGRVGNECALRKAPFGQWVFFGIYCDPQDHKIAFKVPFQAEFAVFFDIQPKNREALRKQPNVNKAIQDLKGQGFEFNFPDTERGRNAWRMCYWREPMSRFEGTELSQLRTMFETQLQTLFSSDFYRIARGQPK